MIRFSLVASAAVVAFALSACTPATESPALSEEETALLMAGDWAAAGFSDSGIG